MNCDLRFLSPASIATILGALSTLGQIADAAKPLFQG